MKLPWRRLAAKIAHRAAGPLSRIKTPHRFYTLDLDARDDEGHLTFASKGPVRWGWSSCELSLTLLSVAMRLDWDHWSHWGLIHEPGRCVNPRPCEATFCGGEVCDDPTETAS